MKNLNTTTTTIDSEAKAAIVERVSTALAAVKTRYKLTDRAFRKRDFFRIAAAEKIEITGGLVAELIEDATDADGMLLKMADGTRAIYLRSFFEHDLDTWSAAKWLGSHFLGHQFTIDEKRQLRSEVPNTAIAQLEADLFAHGMLTA